MINRSVYTCFLYCLIPFIFIKLFIRGVKNRGYWQRIPERFGYYKITSDLKPCIWIHAVSVGETIAAIPMIKALIEQYADYAILVTTTTPTGSDRVKAAFSDQVIHVYAPYDLPGSIRRFLKKLKPAVAVVMETELWPNLLHYTHQQAIPIMIANARISDGSFEGYQKFETLVKSTLSCVNKIAAQGKQDAERFLKIGAKDDQVVIVGSVKFDLHIPNDIQQKADQLLVSWEKKEHILIAASTHDGEEEQILSAFKIIKQTFPLAVLIIVPRHPERFSAVTKLCLQSGFSTVQRSLDQSVTMDTDVFIGDTMGELLLFFTVAQVAFIGGSLIERGGHNPLEAAALKLPVIFGPSMTNFKEIANLLEQSHGAIRIHSVDELAQCVILWFNDEQLRNQIGCHAYTVLENNKGANLKTLQIINKLINKRIE